MEDVQAAEWLGLDRAFHNNDFARAFALAVASGEDGGPYAAMFFEQQAAHQQEVLSAFHEALEADDYAGAFAIAVTEATESVAEGVLQLLWDDE
ncbi:MAG: hypothetical protein ABR529_06530 [Actinomycetota bacterium]